MPQSGNPAQPPMRPHKARLLRATSKPAAAKKTIESRAPSTQTRLLFQPLKRNRIAASI